MLCRSQLYLFACEGGEADIMAEYLPAYEREKLDGG